MAQETIAKVGVKKEAGFLYFVDKEGDIGRAQMARGQRDTGKRSEKVVKVGVKKERGFLYFVNGKGDIARSKMQRGRKE